MGGEETTGEDEVTIGGSPASQSPRQHGSHPRSGKPSIVPDAMVITSRARFDELVNAATSDGREVWIAPAVRDEIRGVRKELPDGVRTCSSLTAREQTEVEKLLPRVSSRGREILKDLRKGVYIGGLGEVQSMVIAKTLGGIFVSGDGPARNLAAVYLGSRERVLSTEEALRLLRGTR